tara:strand:+ start:5551 stop:6216 length:666 start_codon:yes stop_codon:yes gene_type:complete
MRILKNIFKKKLIAQSKNKESRSILAQREFETFIFLIENFYNFNFLKRNYKIFDAGCGDKYLLNIFESKGYEYTGLDINDLNFCNDKIDFKDNRFDFVICLAVIEHIKDPSLFLSEILRILKPNGIFYLTTPNWHYSADIFFDDPTHEKPYTPESLKHLLHSFEYKNIKTFPGLRKKPKWFYSGKYRFFKGRYLFPFKNEINLIPSFLKGKSSSIICISQK